MGRGIRNYGVVLGSLCAVLTVLSMVHGQEKVSSYAPVAIKEAFATIMARMNAAKPDL